MTRHLHKISPSAKSLGLLLRSISLVVSFTATKPRWPPPSFSCVAVTGKTSRRCCWGPRSLPSFRLQGHSDLFFSSQLTARLRRGVRDEFRDYAQIDSNDFAAIY